MNMLGRAKMFILRKQGFLTLVVSFLAIVSTAVAEPRKERIHLGVPILDFDQVGPDIYQGQQASGSSFGAWANEYADDQWGPLPHPCARPQVSTDGPEVVIEWLGDEPVRAIVPFKIRKQSQVPVDPPTDPPTFTCEWGDYTSGTIDRFWDQAQFECPAGTSARTSTTGPRSDYLCSTNQTEIVEAPINADTGCKEGNPCDVTNGRKYQVEIDISGPVLSFTRYYQSGSGLESRATWITNNIFNNSSFPRMGRGWSHTYSGYLLVSGGTFVSGVVRPDGHKIFMQEGASTPSEIGKFFATDKSGIVITRSGTDFILHLPDGSFETYDNKGKLLSMTAVNGHTTTLQYDTTIDRQGLLLSVTGHFGHKLEFDYDESYTYINEVTDPNGNSVTYGYGAGNLISVTYQDSTSRGYHYENSLFPSHLTGITDENGERHAVYIYDSLGRAILTYNGSTNFVGFEYLANGDTKVKLGFGPEIEEKIYSFGSTDYPNPWQQYEYDGQSFATLEAAVADARANSSMAAKQYLTPVAVEAINGVGDGYRKPEGVSLDGASRSVDYHSDYARRVDEITDENGVVTKLSYDDGAGGTDVFHVREVTENYLLNPPQGHVSRTTEYEYLEDTSYLKRFIRTPSVSGGSNQKEIEISYYPGTKNVYQVIESGYDANGNPVADRTTTYSYSATYNQLISIDGPRTDVTDVTNITYYDEAQPGVICDTGGECGQVETITNAKGHVTQFTDYYDDGRVKTMVDSRGITVGYLYDLRGNVLSVTETTPSLALTQVYSYEYDDVGQIDKVTFPNGKILDYEWNAAHLLEWVKDDDVATANRIDFVYDTRGRLKSSNISDSSSFVHRAMEMEYDARDYLSRVEIGTAGIDSRYTFDPLGNLTTVKDDYFDYITTQLAQERQSYTEFDDLNRPDYTDDPQGFTTQYGYDLQDNLVSVEIPKNATDTVDTTYEYDDLGNLLKEDSPDRGVTLFAYDDAGNMVCRLDGRYSSGVSDCMSSSQRVEYAYDKLNRLTDVSYLSDSSKNLQYVYEYYQKPGDLTQVKRVNRNDYLQRNYDEFGKITLQYDYIDNGSGGVENQFTNYSYDSATQDLEKITYPHPRLPSTARREVIYERDDQGRIVGITANFDGTSYTIVKNSAGTPGVEYEPFGPVKKIIFGNDVEQSWIYDDGYRIEQILVTDAGAQTLLDWDFTLDEAANVKSIDKGQVTDNYTYSVMDRVLAEPNGWNANSYDGNGNILYPFYSIGNALTYEADSNRVATKDGDPLVVDYDGMGNIEDFGTGVTFEYDAAGRLEKLTSNGQIVENQYNGFGERSYSHRDVNGTEYVEYFTYAPDGRLLSYTQTVLLSGGGLGARTVYNYVWLDNVPVAQFREQYDSGGVHMGSQLAYIHADHLNTPRLATGTSHIPPNAPDDDAIVWWVFSYAYGKTVEVINPDSDAEFVNIALRFPGQVYYGVGDYNYNYYRDYDTFFGRYLESDPIGLEGGPNTYSYGLQNPLRFFDPYGLWVPPSLPQWLVDSSAGFGDTLSLGGTKVIREAVGVDAVVDECSQAFSAGGLAATGLAVAGGAGLARLGYSAISKAAGPGANWVRYGPSYSKSLNRSVQRSLRWGASPKHAHKIPSEKLRKLNQQLRQKRIPLPGRRFADPGHLHIRF